MANAATATFPGRSLLWGRMRGLGTEAKNVKWGTSATTASANSDVAMFAPATETGAAGTSTMVSTTQLADTYQVVGTLTCLVGAKTITEAVLSDTITLAPTTTVAASMTAAQTTVSLGAASGITTGRYYRQIDNEVVATNGGENTTTETIARGSLGSTSVVHSSGVPTTVGGDGGANANAGIGTQTATVGAAQGGNNFAHADFAGIALAVNDSITFTWKDTLT